MKKIALVFLLVLFGSRMEVEAQDQRRLESVQAEIQKLETELRAREDRERTLLEQLEDIDRRIGLQKKLVDELQQQRRQSEEKIENAQKQLREATRSYEKLKKVVSGRMVSMYKRGRFADWAILFSIRSLSQAAVWMKYKRRIIDNDRRNLRLLEDKKARIESMRADLQRELVAKEKLIRQRTSETGKLEGQKANQRGILTQVRNDKLSIQEQLRIQRMAFREIQGRISREEERRMEDAGRIGDTQFAGMKGKLNWPVKGRVVTDYGRQKHPILKTWTESLGIDIQTNEAGAIQAVHRGIVRWVTWQRGMGNLILVDHGGGYYTVYGHVDVVLVQSGDSVQQGSILGYVGDQSSLYGSTLHFEVWNGTDHQDPKTWFR